MIVDDAFDAVHAVVAGLDVHKMQVTATVRRVRLNANPQTETKDFSTLPDGLCALTDWLQAAGVQASLMESTGIYWLRPFEALEAANLRPQLVRAHKVKQIKGHKTDVADSRWLARVRQYGLATPSYVPPADFRELRQVSRQRRKTIQARTSCHNRIHKLLDRKGLPLGGILSDIFGMNGRRILNGLRDGLGQDVIMASLTFHLRRKFKALNEVLATPLNEVDRWLLGDLLAQRAHLTASANAHARLMRLKLAAYERQLDLLQTLPGIDAQC